MEERPLHELISLAVQEQVYSLADKINVIVNDVAGAVGDILERAVVEEDANTSDTCQCSIDIEEKVRDILGREYTKSKTKPSDGAGR